MIILYVLKQLQYVRWNYLLLFMIFLAWTMNKHPETKEESFGICDQLMVMDWAWNLRAKNSFWFENLHNIVGSLFPSLNHIHR